jgi:N-acetylglucosaminyl-diphospho-decaprenol L-rhamnosyltransferase
MGTVSAPSSDGGTEARLEPPVTVAVVSFNTRELLLRCLASLEGEARARRARVVVVDNGSSDGSAQAARQAAPWAEVLEPGENLGFGAAVNLVAGRSHSEWLAIANADVAPEPGALATLVSAAQVRRVGALAPRLILPDGRTQHSVGPLPTLGLAVAFNVGLPRLVPGLGNRLCLEGYWDPERPRGVPWAIGAFLLLRRTAYDDVGGFDERQWMYAEDLELGWRLHEAGWITIYEPRARVLHADGAATATAFGADRVERFTRATYAVILRRRGLVRTWATAGVNVLGAAARLAWMTPPALVRRRRREQWRETRRWLSAHRQGLRSRAALVRER